MSMSISGTGRLGKDAETKYSTNGTIITEVSFCSSEWNAKEKKNDPTWYKLVMFGDRFGVDKLGKHLTKGKQVSVVGKLKAEEYTDKNGKTRTNLSILVFDLEMILEKRDSSDESQEATDENVDTDQISPPKANSAKASTTSNPAPIRNTPKSNMTPMSNIKIQGVPNFPSQPIRDEDITEEDIPF